MKRCQWVMGLMVAAAMLPTPPANGQTPPPVPPPAATNAQDYSQGFRAFLRLGLPDTSKATYVDLDSDVLRLSGIAGYSLHEVQLRGNAWLLGESTSGTSTLVTASGVVLELVDEKTYRQRRAAGTASNALARTGEDMHRRAEVPTGSWKPCDLGRDLGKAAAFVAKKLEAKAADARELRYDSFLRSDEGPGTLFLLAVLAWQHGRQQEANALAGSLFALVGDSRKVILSAMNVLADAQLAVAGTDFRFTRDWHAYQAAVVALLQKYPAGWRKAGAAGLLQEQLQARAAMQAPPPVTGEGLDDEDGALAAALATEPESASGYGYSGDFWFLVASNRVSRRLPEPKPADVMARIMSRGLRSVPLLLALAGDEVLCPRFRSESGMPTTHTFYENDSGPSDEARTQTYYRQMDRPLTRGEIARHLLAPLCRREESEHRPGDEQTPEEVVEAARETYLALKALPPTEQAGYFLKHGDQNQKQAAIGFLMESGVEAHVPLIEAFLLTPRTEMSDIMSGGYGGGLVSQYVQKRGEAAADFVERYAAMRQKIDLPAGMASNVELVEHMRKLAGREVATLRSLVRKPDLAATIDALVNADSGEDNGVMVAYQTLGRLPADTAVPAMLHAAVQSTNAAARSRLLQMVPMLRFSGMQAQMETEAATGQGLEAVLKTIAARNQASIGTNAAAWKILLADTRPAVSMGMGYGDTRKLTLADLAATAIEALYSADSPMEEFGAGDSAENLPAEVTMRVLRDRATARLAGTSEADLPRLPSAGDVPEERRAALVAAVTQAAPAELPKLLERFSPAETLYLGQAVDDHAALARALAAPSRRIAAVQADTALPAGVVARLKQLEGTAISTNAVETMRDCCRLLLTNGMPCSVNLSSAGLGRGLSLVVQPVGEAGASGMGYSGWLSRLNRKAAQPKGFVTGMLQGGEEGYGHGLWMVELPPADVPAVAAAAEDKTGADEDENEDEDEDDNEEMMERMMESFEEQNQAFDEAARSFCAGDAPLAGNASITFTGLLPPKPGEKSDEDDDDEDMGMILDR